MASPSEERAASCEAVGGKEGDRLERRDAVSDVVVVPINEPWNEVKQVLPFEWRDLSGWMSGAQLILFRNLY